VTFSTVEKVTVVINGGLVVSTSYHRRRRRASASWRGGMYSQMWKVGGRFEVINR
jgi:hypothetical protein